MKLGFVDTILVKYSFEEVMDFASEHNFDNVEVACWPKKSETEIAEFLKNSGNIQESLLNYFLGITHIGIDELNEIK